MVGAERNLQEEFKDNFWLMALFWKTIYVLAHVISRVCLFLNNKSPRIYSHLKENNDQSGQF